MNVPDPIRPARRDDAAAIADMLGQLAAYLKDTDFVSTADTVRTHGFGADPLFHVLVAETDGHYQGMALYLRHYSTTKGAPGVYVQDLFVAPGMRGAGLGERLLARVADHAAREWGAVYLGLTVNQDNPRAAQFYERLGFANLSNIAPLMVAGDGFAALADGVFVDGAKP